VYTPTGGAAQLWAEAVVDAVTLPRLAFHTVCETEAVVLHAPEVVLDGLIVACVWR
jgi:hypothetical protein